MKYNNNVLGSQKAAQPFIINHDNVYIHKNIKKIKITDPVLEYMYQYDEIIMTKDEYIEYIQQQISSNKENSEIQAATISNYILNNEINIDFLVNQLHAGTLSFDQIPTDIYDEVQTAYANKVYHIEYPSIGLDL